METQPTIAALEDVRLAISRQHTQLAQLMDELEAHAEGLLQGKECSAALNDALVLFHGRFVRHLDFEESRLSPLLSGMHTAAALTLKTSMAEHKDQRERADGLLRDREIFADLRTLAREALTFVHMIRKDLAEENEALHGLA